jgi:hypothetical protein
MRLDGSRDAGFLTPTTLAVLVVIGAVIGLGSWIAGRASDAGVPFTATVTISPATAPGLVNLTGCESMAQRFDVDLLAGRGAVTSQTHKLEKGRKQPDASCVFTVSGTVAPSDDYGIRLNDHIGDKGDTVWIAHDDAARADSALMLRADW